MNVLSASLITLSPFMSLNLISPGEVLAFCVACEETSAALWNRPSAT